MQPEKVEAGGPTPPSAGNHADVETPTRVAQDEAHIQGEKALSEEETMPECSPSTASDARGGRHNATDINEVEGPARDYSNETLNAWHAQVGPHFYSPWSVFTPEQTALLMQIPLPSRVTENSAPDATSTPPLPPGSEDTAPCDGCDGPPDTLLESDQSWPQDYLSNSDPRPSRTYKSIGPKNHPKEGDDNPAVPGS